MEGGGGTGGGGGGMWRDVWGLCCVVASLTSVAWCDLVRVCGAPRRALWVMLIAS